MQQSKHKFVIGKLRSLVVCIVILLVVVNCCVVYYDYANNSNGIQLDQVTRPSNIPPLPLQDLANHPKLQALTTAQRRRLNPNCIEYYQDGLWGIQNIFGQTVLQPTYQDISILGNIAVCHSNIGYDIYQLNVSHIVLLTEGILLQNLVPIDATHLQSSIGIHHIEDIIHQSYSPIHIEGIKIVSVEDDLYIVQDQKLLYGIVSRQLEIVVPPYFDYITSFVDSYAIGVKSTEYMWIHTSGKSGIIPPYPSYVPTSISNGIVWYNTYDDKVLLYDLNKTVILDQLMLIDIVQTITTDRIFGNYILVEDAGQYGLYNIFVETIEYFDNIQVIEDQSDMYCIVQVDSKYSLLDSHLNVLAKDMDNIQYHSNILLQQGDISQVFALI
ncbi:MAG: WG repeat-containing protein [Clostridiales bacterium]|jgi:hypothetical protein|nr:WG repeat-containing protein [Clostridiales bacterium]